MGGGLVPEAAGAIGLPLVNNLAAAMRGRGIENVRDLVREAMLDPALARELLARTPPGRVPAPQMRRIIAALTATSALQEQRTAH
jgi:hypothetical protein